MIEMEKGSEGVEEAKRTRDVEIYLRPWGEVSVGMRRLPLHNATTAATMPEGTVASDDPDDDE